MRNTRTPSRVVILRPDNLGDVVLFSGTLRHIRARFPGAEIVFCGRAHARELLQNCPHIDAFVDWDEIHSTPLRRAPQIRGFGRLRRSLTALRIHRALGCDVLLAPVRSPTAGMHFVVRSARAKSKIGVVGDIANQSPRESARSRQWYDAALTLTNAQQWESELRVTQQFLELLEIQVRIVDLWPEFWTTSTDRDWARRHVSPQEGTCMLAIAPGVVSNPGKILPASRYRDAIEGAGSHDWTIVLVGSASDTGACHDVERAVADLRTVRRVINLAGSTTVTQSIEVLRACDIVIAQETAALHIATALRRKTVGIMGGGHYGRFYPWGDHDRNRVAQVRMPCYNCGWTCRFETLRCIQDIPADAIANELRVLMAGQTPSALACT